MFRLGTTIARLKLKDGDGNLLQRVEHGRLIWWSAQILPYFDLRYKFNYVN